MEKNRNIYYTTLLLAFIFLMFALYGCGKFVEVEAPNTSLNSENIYKTDATAASVLTGIYTNLSFAGIPSGALTSVGFLTGLSADELTLFNKDNALASSYYYNSLSAQAQVGPQFWDNSYPMIYMINAAIEGISNSNTLSFAVKKQLLGEAKFMRAFYFFYLVNLYGDIPLTLTTDFKLNKVAKRAPKDQVWEQIVLDLKEAQSQLSSEYLDGTISKKTQERVRPNQMVATALLARVYLYTKDWRNAASQASRVIGNSSYELSGLDDVFLKSSKEAIWQLQPVVLNMNSSEAPLYVPTSSGLSFNQPVYLNNELLEKFDSGDQRKVKWISHFTSDGITYFYPYKYKVLPGNAEVLEYPTVLRLAEQYLIRAEAKIQLDNIADGISDVNQLRARATDNNVAPNMRLAMLPINLSKVDALAAVEKERITELFTEWGHRWLDLKRTGNVDAVMTIEVPKKVPNGVWKNYQQFYPIPIQDIQYNRNLVQNPGY